MVTLLPGSVGPSASANARWVRATAVAGLAGRGTGTGRHRHPVAL